MTRTILSLAEVSAMTGISIETLRFWRKRGDGPPSYRIGRRVVVDLSSLEAWLAEQRRAAGARSA